MAGDDLSIKNVFDQVNRVLETAEYNDSLIGTVIDAARHGSPDPVALRNSSPTVNYSHNSIGAAENFPVSPKVGVRTPAPK